MEKTIEQIIDEATARGTRHANPEWTKMALDAVYQVAKRMSEFTVNNVRWITDASPIKTHDRRAMGGIMRTAEKLGWVQRTSQSIRSKTGHGSPLQVWNSRVY